MNQMKNTKGITLIALVITIIVLLLLAGVTIVSLTGENGLLKNAGQAKEQTEQGKEKEQIKLAYTSQKAELLAKGEKGNVLADDLKNQLIQDGAQVESVTGTDPLTVTMKSGRKYQVTNQGEVSLIVEEKLETVEELQAKYEFKYYSSLTKAITDVNNNTNENSDADATNGKVGVYIKDQVPVVVLMEDITETSMITISKAMDLNLGGRTLSLEQDAYLRIENKVMIEGRLENSKMEQRNQSPSVSRSIFATSNYINLMLNGGTYNFGFNSDSVTSSSITAIGSNSGGNLEINHCNINVNVNGTTEKDCYSISSNTSSNIRINDSTITSNSENIRQQTTVIIRGELDIVDSTINTNVGNSHTTKSSFGISGTNTAGVDTSLQKINCSNVNINISTNKGATYKTIIGINSREGSNMTLANTNVKANSDVAKVYGIINEGNANIMDTQVFADAAGCTIDPNINVNCSVGINNSKTGTLNFQSGSVFATHTGVTNHGKLYVYGGEFTSCGHGGFYFGGDQSSESYVENATIANVNYKGQYEVNKYDYGLAGFYIGGGAENCGIKVYMDHCTITGGNNAFVLRGTSGEMNNSLYISNSTIGNNKIRIDQGGNGTLKLYVGEGTNITQEKINNPSYAEFTNESYKREGN
ncbi:MAG: type II secretion system protein [Clostridia bacterium]|nr:type II secretion system protein [Clostridia bacterium]